MPKSPKNPAGSLRTNKSASFLIPTASELPSWRRTSLILCSLAVLTLIAFLPVFRCDFINYDDGRIIVANPPIRQGLTAPSLFWAWTTLNLGYLQPVTLTSFMLDVDLFGIDHPGNFHATNIAIHIFNVALLYLLLSSATGCRYRSALAAALFAVHPLQVESVAWVSERKGLLATFFALLAMIAYLRYARAAGRPWRGSRLIAYGLSLVLLTLSLLSKPIFVVFPALLLLADIWPLRRFRSAKDLRLAPWRIQPPSVEEHLSKNPKPIAIESQPPPLSPVPLVELFFEKIPYLFIVAVITFVGIRGQQAIGTSVGPSMSPLLSRLAGAAVVCARSVWKSIACFGLATPYPEPGNWPVMQIIASLIVLAAITAVSIWRFHRAPWLLTGWLAFLALLTPITGIISFGGHRFADRYSYVPLICLAVMALWSIPQADGTSRVARRIFPVSAAVVLGTLATLTFFQARYWRDSFTLFQHALRVTGDNVMAYTLLGNALLARDEAGDVRRALDNFEQALAIDPNEQAANLDAALALQKLGRLADAIIHLRRAIDFNPATADGLSARLALGDVLLDQGKIDDAIEQYRIVLQFAPNSARAHCNLGMALAKQGRLQEAIAELTAAIDESPELPEAHRYLATTLLMQGRPDRAYDEFHIALGLEPNSPEGWFGLGNACAALHRFDDAAFAYRRALELRPGYEAARIRLEDVNVGGK